MKTIESEFIPPSELLPNHRSIHKNSKWRSLFWQIRSPIPHRLYYSMVLLSIAIPLCIWSLFTYSGWVDPLFMPTPSAVLHSGYELLHSGKLMGDVAVSVTRIAWGFLLSAALSIPVGLLIGTFKSIEGLLEPIAGLMRYMPAAAFIPLIILWLGLGEPSKIAIIFLGSFFYNILMIADAVKFIPLDLIKTAYTLGSTRKDVFFHVIFPATLPNIIDTLRINIAGAWNFVVVAELVAANSGLGYHILLAQRYLKTDQIFVGILLIGFIGLAIDCAFKLIVRLVVPWAINRS
jgi:NitT/TauT family transport system permease protein